MGNLLSYYKFMEWTQQIPLSQHFGKRIIQRSRSPDNNLHSFSISNGNVLFEARIRIKDQKVIAGQLIFLELNLENKTLTITVKRPKFVHQEIPLENLVRLKRIQLLPDSKASTRKALTINVPKPLRGEVSCVAHPIPTAETGPRRV